MITIINLIKILKRVVNHLYLNIEYTFIYNVVDS